MLATLCPSIFRNIPIVLNTVDNCTLIDIHSNKTVSLWLVNKDLYNVQSAVFSIKLIHTVPDNIASSNLNSVQATIVYGSVLEVYYTGGLV